MQEVMAVRVANLAQEAARTSLHARVWLVRSRTRNKDGHQYLAGLDRFGDPRSQSGKEKYIASRTQSLASGSSGGPPLLDTFLLNRSFGYMVNLLMCIFLLHSLGSQIEAAVKII